MKQSSPSRAKRNQRQQVADSLIVTLQKLKSDQQLIFLTAYICPTINLLPQIKNVTQLQRILVQLNSNVEYGLISFNNMIEIIAEIIYKWNKDNKITNVQICRRFDQQAQGLCGQVICTNRKYLRQKWFKELKNQSSGFSYIQPKMENQEESLKLIMLLQEQDKKQQERLRLEKDKQSEKFLKQLLKQQQEQNQKKRKEKLMQIEKLEKQNLTCQICLDEIRYTDVGTLSCTHIFHKACIRGHIEALVMEKKLDIPCPAGCGKNLPLQDIEEYIDGGLKEKFQKFCFDMYVQKHDKEVSWCPTPGCTAVFTRQGGLDNYRCPVCNKHYCLSCRCQYHRGQSCAEYRINNSYGQDDKKFQQFVRGAKFKQCPKCKFWVERVEGCSTMACRCGHEFCYDCGGSDCPHGMCKHGGGGGILPMPAIFRGGRRR